MSPLDRRHGTEAGYEQHVRDGEDPCDDCKRGDYVASRRRSKRRAMGYRYQLPVGETIHATLVDLRRRGATHEDIAEWADMVPSQVWRIIRIGPEAEVYARTYRRLQALRPPEQIVTPLGLTRRVRALARLGYSNAVIAREAGVNVNTVQDICKEPPAFLMWRTRDALVAAYDRLCMKLPDTSESYLQRSVSRTRNRAAREGWVSALAWDDIDADPGPIAGQHRSKCHEEADEAVVLRILSGERLEANAAERREVLRRWSATGHSIASMCREQGWKQARDYRLEEQEAS